MHLASFLNEIASLQACHGNRGNKKKTRIIKSYLEEIKEGHVFDFGTIFVFIIFEEKEVCKCSIKKLRILFCHHNKLEPFFSTVTSTPECFVNLV